MARRRREGKEPDLGFEVPEFDEAEFIRKETISFRTTLILFLYSIVTALVSFVAWVYTDHNWWTALLVGMALGVALRWMFPALKVDVSHFKRKEWIGTGFLYFFSWLAFIIFLTNPPLYDGVPPTLDIHVTPDAQEPGGPVNITLVAVDNIGIDIDTLQITVTGPDGPLADTSAFTALNHTGLWATTFDDLPAGTYTITARIQDVPAGLLDREAHTTTSTTTFTVGTNVLRVDISNQVGGSTVGRLNGPLDSVAVTFPASIDTYRVWLQPEGDASESARILLDKDDDVSNDDRQVWFARPDFQGFTEGNNTFRVHVREHDNYLLAERYAQEPIAATLVSNQTYTAVIDDPTLLGDAVPGQPRQRAAFPAQTPGIEAVLLVVVLVGVVALARRRRE